MTHRSNLAPGGRVLRGRPARHSSRRGSPELRQDVQIGGSWWGRRGDHAEEPARSKVSNTVTETPLWHSERTYRIHLEDSEFLCRFLCKSFTPPAETLMNTQTHRSSSATLTLQPLRPGELASAGEPRLSWLWDGYLAPGKITALISPPKSGKTTLLSHLLARCAQGGLLAGRAVAPGRALVVSEEAASDWDARCGRLGLGPNVQFLCRPFRGARPTDAGWFALVAGLETLHHQEALDLVVLDALATLLPGQAETCAPKMLDCLLPLQALANRGPALWLLHHPAKAKRPDGQSGRGSGTLSGFADVVMEMTCYRRARSRDRRRRICAWSRYAETPRHLLLELNADGGDYLVRSDAAGAPPGTTLAGDALRPGQRQRQAHPAVDPRTLAYRGRPAGPLEPVALAETGHPAGRDLLLRQRLPRRSLPLLAARPRSSALAGQRRQRGGKASLERAPRGAPSHQARAAGSNVMGRWRRGPTPRALLPQTGPHSESTSEPADRAKRPLLERRRNRSLLGRIDEGGGCQVSVVYPRRSRRSRDGASVCRTGAGCADELAPCGGSHRSAPRESR
jgi:hypothetical protein